MTLLEKLKKRVPSPNNLTCECAGEKQCDACLIAEALEEIERLKIIEDAFLRGNLKNV